MPTPSSFELEIKLGLPDEAAWRAVRALLRARSVEHQTNHFFDTPDRALERARIGVRLRKCDDAIGITVKAEAKPERKAEGNMEGKVEGQGGPNHDDSPQAMITRRIELEKAVSHGEFEEAMRDGLDLAPWLDAWRSGPDGRDPQIATVIDALTGAGRLETFGAFTNERTIGRLDLTAREEPIEVELDRTTFPGERIDYELEIELDSDTALHDVEETRSAVLDRLAALDIRPTAAPSKLARFRDALDRRAPRTRV